MIIVSQDKKSIYNFNNVKSVDILNNEIFISDDILADTGVCVGSYETEKRAEEVLLDIVKRFEHCSHMFSRKSFITQNIMDYDFIYEMPKE